MSKSIPPEARRALNALLAVAVAVAAVGFLTGTRGAPTTGGYRVPAAETTLARARARAPKHRDMEETRYAERRAQQHSALRAMASPGRSPTDPIVRDAQAYALAVSRRTQGRVAYDGAPPTIPHAVDQAGAPACLACHEHGLRSEQKLASPMGHQMYASCLSCHATRESDLPVAELLPASVSEVSTFVGLGSPGLGGRAWAGAPPQMPHRSFMRERCVSCHGVWAEGLASTHPYRQSCTQCHAPPSTSDQMPRSTFAPLGVGVEP